MFVCLTFLFATLLLIVLIRYLNCLNEIKIFIEPSDFTLGWFIGNETKLIEFKEFSPMKGFHRHKKKIDAEQIIKKKDWGKIVKISEKVLEIYINSYIPKYMSSFCNTFGGILYFGISDDGEVIGIPINPKNVVKVKNLIKSKVEEILKLNKIKTNKVKIKIIKCKYDKDYIDTNYKPLIDNYNNELHNYYKNINKKKKINEKINLYKSAINNILNNKKIREELIKYMKKNGASLELINELEERERIILDNDKISIDKVDKKTLSYWIVNYRTYIVEKIKKNKPDAYKLIKPCNPYYNILNNIKLLSSDMVKKGYHFYIIKINFPKFKKRIFYMHDNKKIYSKRVIGGNGPMTVDL